MGQRETELCFFANVENKAGLLEAVSIEIHDQWEYKLPVGEDGKAKGRVRVRRTEKNDVVSYAETLKVPFFNEGVQQGDTEYTTEISEEYYMAWVSTFGSVGTKKIRYTFITKNVELTTGGDVVKLPELLFEVDILVDPQGKQSKWCKIDVELDKALAVLTEQHPDVRSYDLTVKLSELPFKPTDVVSALTTDESERAGIQAFWKRFEHAKVS